MSGFKQPSKAEIVAGMEPKAAPVMAEAPNRLIIEKDFFQREFITIFKHIEQTSKRALQSVELPYFVFFYRWSEYLSELFNAYHRQQALMVAMEAELKGLREEVRVVKGNEGLSKDDADRLRKQNRDLSSALNQAQQSLISVRDKLSVRNSEHREQLVQLNECKTIKDVRKVLENGKSNGSE